MSLRWMPASHGLTLLAAGAILALSMYLGPSIPDWMPDWGVVAILAAAWVSAGAGLQKLDTHRWRRSCRTLDLSPAPDGQGQRSPMVGTRRGRTVRAWLNETSGPRSPKRTVAEVELEREGPGELLLVHPIGAPGTGSSGDPPVVPTGQATFDETHEARSGDAELVRDVVTLRVQQAVRAVEGLVRVEVEDGTVHVALLGRVLDPALVDPMLDLAIAVAEATDEALEHRAGYG